MMQDTVLSMCKESVSQFVEFVLQYIPKETHIESTSRVKNIFEKKALPEGETEEDQEQLEVIPEEEMTTIQQVRKELN